MAETYTEFFGRCADGRQAKRIWISDGAGNRAGILNYGAALQSLLIKCPDGETRDVCLGYDSIAEYENSDGCLGGTVGRCANRIGDSTFTLSGQDYKVSPNRGSFHLHGGFEGFHKKLWSDQISDSAVCLSYFSPNGEEGYPGNLRATVHYAWVSEGVLRVEYDCVSDQETVINLTNHSYFNLNGQASGDVLGHKLQIFSDTAALSDKNNTPTGETFPVEGTPLDFSQPQLIGSRINADYPSLRRSGGYDHSYLLPGGEIRPTAKLWGGGLEMDVSTDLPALGLYTANFLSPRRGKAGAEYAPFQGVCLETQFLPNAVNLPGIEPKPIFKAGEHYHFTTLFRFSPADMP